MANEISVNLSLSVRNGLYEDSMSAAGRFDQTTLLAAGAVIDVSTNVETVSLGEVSTAGYAAFRNLSTATAGTAYVALGAYDGTSLHEFVHLRRGQPGLVPLAKSVTVGARAYGSATKMQYIVLAE
jgi:hypothetical protein